MRIIIQSEDSLFCRQIVRVEQFDLKESIARESLMNEIRDAIREINMGLPDTD